MSPGRREQLARRASNQTALNSTFVERFLAELEFVEGLAEVVGKKVAAGWARRMDLAFEKVAQAVDAGSLDRIEKAVEDAEGILAPIGKIAKTYTIHCVGHGHIDMNWMWSWPETVAVTNDTFLTVLKLMDEFDDFCYTQSQASVYEIVRRHNPELFERIKKRVKEGRWEVAASHWVEGDKNIASGEALARHLLYTRRYMKEHLGLEPRDVPIDWSPDTFGHAVTIPMIDSAGGVKYYYMCRGGNWEKPPVFWYRSPDGSRILVNLETTWYNDHIGPHNAIAMLQFCRKTGLKDWLNVYGVGDHGGGPTRRDILRCYEMDGWPIYPTFRLATTRDYYKILEKNGDKWPVIDRELNFEFTGCYTTQTQIKRNNRLGENHLVEAEIAASLGSRALGREYPGKILRDAWVDVLFCHFHDILPGSGVAETRQYNQGLFQKVAAATHMIKTNSLRAIAAAVDTSFAGSADTDEVVPARSSLAIGGGAGRGTYWGGMSEAGHVVDGPRPFVVFNPTAWPRREVVKATVWDADTGPSGTDLKRKNFVVRTVDGKVVPAQKVHTGDYWGHKFVEVVFPVEVGALGYTACAIEEGTVEGFAAPLKAVEQPPRHVQYGPGHPVLENEFLAVEFDPLTGGVLKLLDKKSGRDLADPAHPLGVLEYVVERPYGMSAWVISDIQELGYPLQVYSLKDTQHGPFQASVEAKLKVRSSDATVTYTLKAGQPWLEIAIQVRWVEIGSKDKGGPGLRMRFPLALRQAGALYEVPFGSLERDLNKGEEVPALRWVDVTGKASQSRGSAGARASARGDTAGCAVANDCKYGYSLDGSILRATLIRSSYDPDPIPEVGDHLIRFAVMPHAARPARADLVRFGAAFNHPLHVVATDAHTGNLPASGAAVPTVAPEGVVLSSLKRAEDADGFIVRLCETAGKGSTAKVAFSPALLGKVRKVVEVDLLERPVATSRAAKVAGGFSVKVPAFGIASVKVTFED
jgi:alpha-mannosidase